MIFSLGADHLFVATDKWRNARLERPHATTEEIAAVAFPSAASAMFLTTTTTAVAFFGTVITPVAPIRLFAIFCGLLVVIDYILDVLIFFPALAMYDKMNHQNCLVRIDTCLPCRKDPTQEEDVHQDKPSLIRRILTAYYNGLHAIRWPLLVACLGAICICTYFSTKLDQPVSNELRILNPAAEVEKANVWMRNLLVDSLRKQQGSMGFVVFGVKAADTGDHNDPYSWTTLELDDTFDPSTQEAQLYLRDFCDRFLVQDFAKDKLPDNYTCHINRFDSWLQIQAASEAPEDTYLSFCSGETRLPLSEGSFHACLSAWAQKEGVQDIISRDGIVKIIHIPFTLRIFFLSPNEMIKKEWHLIEDWMNRNNENAPAEVKNAYVSSADFWFWDSIYQLYSAAVGSAGIALATSGLIILLTSQSVAMTVFSVVSVCYVLTSVCSMMVACGWELGLLESICFTILIGISVDFVIHFSHAYTEQLGHIDRHTRTKVSLIHMGPSVLAAAFTTAASAIVMLFTTIMFFRLFATALVFTILQSIVGSFVVFLALTDALGPANPRKLFDYLKSRLRKCTGDESVARTRAGSDGESIPSDSDVQREECTQDLRGSRARLGSDVESLPSDSAAPKEEGTEYQGVSRNSLPSGVRPGRSWSEEVEV